MISLKDTCEDRRIRELRLNTIQPPFDHPGILLERSILATRERESGESERV